MKLLNWVTMIIAVFSFTGDAWAVSGLRIKCDQEGADIYLDGKLEGQCPKNVVVTSGGHKVTLRKILEDKSYYYFEADIQIADGAIEKIEAKLNRIYDEAYYYAKAKNSNAVADYQDYIKRYPSGQMVEEAKRKLDAIEADFYAKAKSGNSLEGYQRYLTNFSNGRYSAEVKDALGRAHARQIELVTVKGGCFQMGDLSGDGQADEKPVHEVCVDDFAIGKHEVTVAEFNRFVGLTGYLTDAEKSPGGNKGCMAYDQEDKKQAWAYRDWANWREPNKYQRNEDSHPVTCVSWNDAMAYTKWLSSVSDRKFRLPTEAEWEFAARGGTVKRNYWGDGKEEVCRYANVADKTALPNRYTWNDPHACTDGYAFVAPVGKFQPNAIGLFDIMGNVQEWTSDWKGDKFFAESPKDNPKGPATGSYRVFRGGAFNDGPSFLRASKRASGGPAFRRNNLGIRLVSSAK